LLPKKSNQPTLVYSCLITSQNQPLIQPNTEDIFIPFSAAHLKQFTFKWRNLIATKFQSPVNMPPKHIKRVTHACCQQFQTQLYQEGLVIYVTPSETSAQFDLEGMFACGRMKTFAAPFRRLFNWHRGHYENMLRPSFQLLLSSAQHNY
jgi:hypothetical protein